MFKVQSEFLFPKQVIISDDEEYPEYRNSLVEYCYEQLSKNRNGVEYSNIGGWQSDPFSLLYDNNFNFFKERLFDNIKYCLENEFMLIKSHIEIPRIWINISGKNHYNIIHTHPFSHFSGVFYVKSTENCGEIAFHISAMESQECFFRHPEIKKSKNILPNKTYFPKEGRMLLFPSLLSHGVNMNQSDSDRISISFDLVFSDYIE